MNINGCTGGLAGFFALPISTIKTNCLPYTLLQKTPNLYIFTLKMETAMFVETLDSFQHSMLLIPESQGCTLNSSRKTLKTRRSV
jgi:hypothetical protein